MLVIYIDYENSFNPFEERKNEVIKWKQIASENITETEEILKTMNTITQMGLKALDSLHIACSIQLKCDYFVTVDKEILKKGFELSKENISIINPVDLIFILEEEI